MKTRATASILFVALASLTVAACSGDKPAADCEPAAVSLPEGVTAELARVLDEFDPVGLSSLIADDARLLPPNVPAVEGREAIIEHYKGSVARELHHEVTPITQVVIGNVGLAEGTYRVKNLTSGTYVEHGKFMIVWVNQDGAWKVARLMINTDYQVARTSVTVDEPVATGVPSQ
jgi:ketosteroid isomerase-like protein